MLKHGMNKEGHIERKLNIDAQKGDYSRVPVDMWYERACAYEGDRESGGLKVLRDSMLRWWSQKLTRESSQVLRRISGSWKRVGSSQRII